MTSCFVQSLAFSGDGAWAQYCSSAFLFLFSFSSRRENCVDGMLRLHWDFSKAQHCSETRGWA